MSQNTVKLFKTLVTEASKIPDFNFRNYFVRRITDSFYNGQELRSQEDIDKNLAQSKISLEMIKRQAAIGQLFDENRTVPLSKWFLRWDVFFKFVVLSNK